MTKRLTPKKKLECVLTILSLVALHTHVINSRRCEVAYVYSTKKDNAQVITWESLLLYIGLREADAVSYVDI